MGVGITSSNWSLGLMSRFRHLPRGKSLKLYVQWLSGFRPSGEVFDVECSEEGVLFVPSFLPVKDFPFDCNLLLVLSYLPPGFMPRIIAGWAVYLSWYGMCLRTRGSFDET